MVFVVYLVVAIISGVIGSSMARSRGRDAALWFVVCAFIPIIGIIALAVAGDAASGIGVETKTEGRAASNGGIDNIKWKTLIELDPDIAAAAEEVRGYGQKYEMIFAEKYLTLNDKSYLRNARDLVINIALDERNNMSQFQKSIASDKIVLGFHIYETNDGRIITDVANSDGTMMTFHSVDAAEFYIRTARSKNIPMVRAKLPL